jgi:hypothetical protein
MFFLESDRWAKLTLVVWIHGHLLDWPEQRAAGEGAR